MPGPLHTRFPYHSSQSASCWFMRWTTPPGDRRGDGVGAGLREYTVSIFPSCKVQDQGLTQAPGSAFFPLNSTSTLWVRQNGHRSAVLLCCANPGGEPTVTLCTCHPGSHAPVYFYEFQHSPNFMKDLRPPYVKADHGDELFFFFRSIFFETKGEASSFPIVGM